MLLHRHLVWGDSSRLKIASTAQVNNTLFNTVSGTINVDEYAMLAHNVCVITGTHDIELFEEKRKFTFPTFGRDVVIRRGAWIGSNATILGPCVIGENAVVAAGAVVVRDVEPGTVVGGVPAKLIKHLKSY